MTFDYFKNQPLLKNQSLRVGVRVGVRACRLPNLLSLEMCV